MSDPMEHWQERLSRIEESLAFVERHADGATEQILDLDRQVRELTKRVQRLEHALGVVRERVAELAQGEPPAGAPGGA